MKSQTNSVYFNNLYIYFTDKVICCLPLPGLHFGVLSLKLKD